MACQQHEKMEPITASELTNSATGIITLGEKLENPYSVKNMRSAYKNLQGNAQQKIAANQADITVTHYYVRFLPETKEEYAQLTSDTTLVLFDYPLDYEIVEGGTVGFP